MGTPSPAVLITAVRTAPRASRRTYADSVLCACLSAGDPEMGRDRQVLTALRASRVPFIHLILGPGCDGESGVEQMREAMREADARQQIAGLLPLEVLAPQMRVLSATLKSSRTPNIIADAIEAESRRGQQRGQHDAYSTEMRTIVRHGRTQAVPLRWLTVAVALSDPPTGAMASASQALLKGVELLRQWFCKVAAICCLQS